MIFRLNMTKQKINTPKIEYIYIKDMIITQMSVAVKKKVTPVFRKNTLIKMYKKMILSRDEYVDAIIVEGFEFIFRIRNMAGPNNEFNDGEYLFKLIPPSDFPYAPPSLIFLTPNGVYGLKGKICISTGEFHKQNFAATRGMIGFGTDVWTAMIQYPDLGGGIQILPNRNPYNIAKYAKRSKTFNRKHFAKYINMLERLPCNKKYEMFKNTHISVKLIDQTFRLYMGI